MTILRPYRLSGLLFENARTLATTPVTDEQLAEWQRKYSDCQEYIDAVSKCVGESNEDGRVFYLAKTLKTLFELCTSDAELGRVIESLDILCNGIAKAPIDTSFAA